MDCTPNCKLKSHGTYLTSSITSEPLDIIRSSITDKCSNPCRVSDHVGRNVFHMAASCGNCHALEYLYEHLHTSKNSLQSKDKESGWTPLHRAIYYGHINCAVFLFKVLKEWRPFDSEGFSPLDLAIQESPRIKKKKENKIKLGRVVIPFEAELPREMTLQQNDIIEIANHQSGLTGWAVGKNQNTGKTGCYPINFVEEIVEKSENEDVAGWYLPQNTVYLWGNNANFTNGLGDSKVRNMPELNEIIFQNKHSVIDVVVTKFHSVFLTEEGKVLSCGHGPGGRLGHGKEETLLYPRLVDSLSCYQCIAIAASNHHTVVLTKHGDVFTFGLNDFNQLGQSSSVPFVKSSLIPNLIYSKNIKNRNIIGVTAARFHTAVYSESEVYVFGTNGGQLGLLKSDEVVPTPKLVSRLLGNKTCIKKVVASDGATLCLFGDGELYILQDFICRKIKDIGMFLPGTTIKITGGALNLQRLESDKAEPLQIAILQSSGVVYIWRSGTRSFKECSWHGCRLPAYTKVVDICLGKNVIITTDTGQVYLGYFRNLGKSKNASFAVPSSKSSSKVEVLSSKQGFTLDQVHERTKKLRLDYEEINLEQVPLLYRGVRCFSDPKSRNYAVIQYDPRVEVKRMPQVLTSLLEKDLQRLLESTKLPESSFCDVLFTTKGKTFQAHKIVLQCRLGFEAFESLSNNSHQNENDLTVILKERMSDNEFEKWLKNIYSCNQESIRNLSNVSTNKTQEEECEGSKGKDDFVKQLARLSKLDIADPTHESFEYTSTDETSDPNYSSSSETKKRSAYAVHKEQKRLNTQKANLKKKKEPSWRLYSFDSWRKFSNSSDVVIESEDGKLFHCHKCILTLRSEYFQNMLSFGWMESSLSRTSSVKIPIPGDLLDVLLNFFYTGNIKKLDGSDDVSFIGEVLVCSDQLLVARLKELCEACLAKKVNLKNAVDVFQFACTYNAQQLQKFTCNYVSMNLPYFLDARLLENVSSENLKILSNEYRNLVAGMDSRHIVPSFLHREIDRKKEQFRNSIAVDLNKFKARRKRLSTSECLDTAANSKLVQGRDDEKEKLNVKVASNLNTGLREIVKDTIAPKAHSQKEQVSAWNKSSSKLTVSLEKLGEVEERKKQGAPSPFKKKSQRERRRETSQSKSENEDSNVVNKDPNVVNKEDQKECPWGKSPNTHPVKSFKDLMSEESSPTTSSQTSSQTNVNNKKSGKQKFKTKLVLGVERLVQNQEGDKKNAWGVVPSATTAMEKEDNRNETSSPFKQPKETNKKNDFAQILEVQTEEKKQHIKDLKKPITVIQLEERAMEELKSFYEKNAKDGERITVKRVKRLVDVLPFWDRVVQ